MKKSSHKKYRFISLVVVLAFSLVLPYCCHTDISALFSQQQETTAHAGHGQGSDSQQCDCGHEFVKDFQKNKKISSGFTAHFSLEATFLNHFSIHLDQAVLNLSVTQTGFIAFSGPPIHLFNSVFLN